MIELRAIGMEEDALLTDAERAQKALRLRLKLIWIALVKIGLTMLAGLIFYSIAVSTYVFFHSFIPGGAVSLIHIKFIMDHLKREMDILAYSSKTFGLVLGSYIYLKITSFDFLLFIIGFAVVNTIILFVMIISTFVEPEEK